MSVGENDRPRSEGQDAALPFDPDALREKYRIERDKRLRLDGNDQYVEVIGQFAKFVDDPYVARIEREPLVDEVQVAVVGGGFGALLIGARLKEVGIDDLRLIDNAGDFGGTWYWNRYPGAACDTESYIYLPLLEEVGYMPTEKYAKAPEIRAHSQAIARQFDLYRNACLQTQVTEVRWDDDIARWIISTDRGDRMRARFVCMANGPLNRPKLPGVVGIDSYEGHMFHTSRWDYAYTGGDGYGNLTGLRDKVVGIIGTGATAVQAVPHLGESAKHLYVFQRTPSSIDVRGNRPTDPEWVKSLQPGWQKRRMENFTTITAGGYAEEDLVNDGWTEIIGKLLVWMRGADATDVDPSAIARSMEMADFEKMEQIRARVDAIVKDKDTAEALKPYYRQFCKRPCFHDEYLQTFNRPNVSLVDTQGKGVERITERGVVANGVEYALDCLILATGFEFGTGYVRRAGYDVIGRQGLTLSEKWKDGASTFHGMQTRGFPNCFIVGISQAGVTANIPHMLDEQARHIAYIVQESEKRGAETVDVDAKVEADWVQRHIEASAITREFFEACTPGYYNNEGKSTDPAVIRNGPFAAGPVTFFNILESWRNDGNLPGLELT